MGKVFVFLIILLTALTTSNASNVQNNPQSDHNLPPHTLEGIIKISAALTVEPYVIKARNPEDKASGLEVEIVREALALQGYGVKFVYEPLKRTKFSFKRKRVDGVMDVKDHYPEIQGSFLSDEHIIYSNTVVTLKANNITIKKIGDLTDKTVIGFQQANIAFGEEFKTMTENNPKYSEMANQSNQIAMLFLNRIDAIVLDRYIFKYHRNRLKAIQSDQPVTFHGLFEPSKFKIAFKERKIREAFNLGLKKLQASGRYQEIIDSYITK